MRIAAASRAGRLITVCRGAEAMDIAAASAEGAQEGARITAADIVKRRLIDTGCGSAR